MTAPQEDSGTVRCNLCGLAYEGTTPSDLCPRCAPGCEECGNEEATVVITNGMKVCTGCAEKLDP